MSKYLPSPSKLHVTDVTLFQVTAAAGLTTRRLYMPYCLSGPPLTHTSRRYDSQEQTEPASHAQTYGRCGVEHAKRLHSVRSLI
jgi:hypothetical protein